MKKGDEASPSIILAGQALLVKMIITLEPHGMFCSNFVYLCILTFPDNGMKKDDEASPNIIFAGQALLVKMLIILELQIVYTYVFLHCPATGIKKGDEASPNIILAS